MTQVAHSNHSQASSGDQEMGTGKKDSQVAGLIHTHTDYWGELQVLLVKVR